jgi:PKD repeat protein
MAVDSNGNNIWASYGNTTDPHVARLESLSYTNNTIAATGAFEDSLQWGTVNRHTYYLGDAFLVRLNAATGNLIGLDTLHASNGSAGQVITSDKNSNFYVGGFFNAQLFFNNGTITVLDTSSFHRDWFVAKFGASNTCSCNLPQPNYTHTHTGNTYNFTYSGTTPYLSIDWDFGDGTTASNVTMPVHNYPSVGNYPVCVTVSDGCGSNTACHSISIVTGINDLTTLSGIQIYPNPATEYLTIKNTASGTAMDVYNITGSRVIHTVLNQQESTVDIHSFAAGIYLVRFTNAAGASESIKFVKR